MKFPNSSVNASTQCCSILTSGRLDEAEASYRLALQTDSQHRNALVNLARLLRTKGFVVEASAYFYR